MHPDNENKSTDLKGEYPYYCKRYPTMIGKIKVILKRVGIILGFFIKKLIIFHSNFEASKNSRRIDIDFLIVDFTVPSGMFKYLDISDCVNPLK